MQKRRGRGRIVIGTNENRQMRPCMCCLTPFPSYGTHNRLCLSCKNMESDFSLLGLRSRR